jgi:ssDNA thymidine ADP-ribosyltransferase, DarT
VERSQLVELHFITPFQNLSSIAHHGILCHERAARLSHASIAMESVQERRSKVRVPGGLRLHEYANLYFNARNTMMYVRTHKHLSIGVVSVRPAVLDGKGVVIADRNASTDAVEFGTPEEMLPKLDYDTIFAERCVRTRFMLDTVAPVAR